MELVFATNNEHKLREVRKLADTRFSIVGLSEVGIFEDIPEEQNSLEGNASQKAWFIYNKTSLNCFADDTGLEVSALQGEPGVFSARYSRYGKPVFPEMEVTEANIQKLLLNLKNEYNRVARFRTVISLIINQKEFFFEGIVNGTILDHKRGESGFGYDPVFIPDGFNKTFAEMNMNEKNLISHRALAIQNLIDFLHKL
jgi:XTP/dITP diphosphohydrolase